MYTSATANTGIVGQSSVVGRHFTFGNNCGPGYCSTVSGEDWFIIILANGLIGDFYYAVADGSTGRGVVTVTARGSPIASPVPTFDQPMALAMLAQPARFAKIADAKPARLRVSGRRG